MDLIWFLFKGLLTVALWSALLGWLASITMDRGTNRFLVILAIVLASAALTATAGFVVLGSSRAGLPHDLASPLFYTFFNKLTLERHPAMWGVMPVVQIGYMTWIAHRTRSWLMSRRA